MAAGDSRGKAELVSRQLTWRCLLPPRLCLEPALEPGPACTAEQGREPEQ